MGDRVKKLILIFLCLTGTAHAAKILQTKAKSAIIEVSEGEIDDLKLAAGQNIQFTASGATVQGSVVKIIKNKILVKANSDLTGQQNAQIELSILNGALPTTDAAAAPIAPAARPQRTHKEKSSAYVRSGSGSKKPWISGVNLKYIKGSSKIQFADTVVGAVTVPGFSFNQSTTGFDLSGVGIYYFGQMGAGVELEYASIKGSDSTYSSTITQMQLSGLGEYKFDAFSAGVILTVASNYKASDSSGNDSSLNGTGFGVFGTYQVTPEIRAVIDYKSVTYTLDSNSISMADFRIGAGYYF